MNPGWDVSQRGSHEILVQVWEKGQISFFFLMSYEGYYYCYYASPSSAGYIMVKS